MGQEVQSNKKILNNSEKIDFISECPAINCNNLKKYEWSHGKCGGKEWLNDEGYLICKACYQNGPLISWKFRCGEHSDFRETNKEKICEILSIAASIESGNRKFKARLLKAVANMLDDE